MTESDAAPDLFDTGTEIGWPDTEAETATRARLGTTVIGAGALGRLSDLAIWLSGVQGVSPPQEPHRPRLILFAAGPPAGFTGDGPGPAELFAAAAGVGLRVVDLTAEPAAADPAVADPGTATRAAIRTGIRVADEEIDAGADLLAVGALGSASATAAAVVVSVMTLVEPIKVVGATSPAGDQAWMRQVAEIRDTRLRGLPHRHDAEALLTTVGGTDLAAITGFLVRAAARRTPVILDGMIVGAAAALAREISPNTVRWWLSGERGTDPANQLALAEFSAVPILDLGLEIGDGVGAVLAVPVIRAAARAASDLPVVATEPPDPATETETETDDTDTDTEAVAGPELGTAPDDDPPQTAIGDRIIGNDDPTGVPTDGG